MSIRRFHLLRHEDVHDNSGTGVVAEGAEFTCGRVAMTWLTPFYSVTVFDNIKTLEELHGHEGKTEIVWDDPE